MSTYRLLVRQGEGDGAIISQGTGFFTARDRVVTAFHVVGSVHAGALFHESDPAIVYTLVVDGSPGAASIRLEPLGFDLAADVALLQTAAPANSPYIWRLAESSPRREQKWHTHGFPAFHQGTFALNGRIASLHSDETPDRTLQLTIKQGTQVSWEGASGSPVCNEEHRVCGVITRITDGTNTGWAALTRPVRTLMQQYPSREPRRSTGPSEIELWLDRNEQWKRIEDICTQSTSSTVSVIFGHEGEGVEYFCQRVQTSFNKGRTSPYPVHRLSLRVDNHIPTYAEDWEDRLCVVAQQYGQGSVQQALTWATKHSPIMVIVGSPPLCELEPEETQAFITFIGESLPVLIDAANLTHPVHVLVPVEYRDPHSAYTAPLLRAIFQAVHQARAKGLRTTELDASTKRSGLSDDIEQLTFPPWGQVEHFLMERVSHDTDLLEECLRAYDEIVVLPAAERTTRNLTKRLTGIITEYKQRTRNTR